MSVGASIYCSNCTESGPAIGDLGAIGFPSLKDTAMIEGEFASFEHIYRGFLALGLRLRDLDLIRHWLFRHIGHKVGLRFDDESGGRRVLSKPEPGRYALDLPDSSHFEESAYRRAFLEARCARCSATERVGPVQAVPFSLSLEPKRIAEFEARVRELDSCNFHRCFGLLDPYSSDTESFGRFLIAHRKHDVVLRTIDKEEISLGALPKLPVRTGDSFGAGDALPSDLSFPPPLKIAWTRDIDLSWPLIHQGRIYGYRGNRESVICCDLDGTLIWQSEPLGEWRGVFCISRSRVFVPGGNPRTENSEVAELDLISGATTSRLPTAFFYQGTLDGGGFIGLRLDRDATSIGLYEPDGKTPAWQVIEPAFKTPSRGGIGEASRVLGSTLLVDRRTGVAALELATGRELWFVDIGLRYRVNASESFLLHDQTLVICEAGLSAVNAGTGELLWRDEKSWGKMAVSDCLVVCVETMMSFEPSKRIQARSLKDGSSVFDNHLDTPAWKALPPPLPRLTTQPVLIGPHIYVGDETRLYCLSAETGDPLWVTHLPGGSGRILIASGRMFISNGKQLTLLEPADPEPEA